MEKKELSEVLRTDLRVENFKLEFDKGYENYISGDWGSALAYFELALKYKKDDGPTINLMTYINDKMKNGTAPPTWKHYRELT